MVKEYYLFMNPGSARMLPALPAGMELIVSRASLQQFFRTTNGKESKIQGIGIEINLNWDIKGPNERESSENHGFDLLQELKVRHYKCPVLLTSNFQSEPIEFSEKYLNNRFRFWLDPSIAYKPLSELETEPLEHLVSQFPQAVDDALFEDLLSSAYDKVGYLEVILHDLSRASRTLDKADLIRTLQEKFTLLRYLFSWQAEGILELEQKVLKDLAPLHNRDAWQELMYLHRKNIKKFLSNTTKPQLSLRESLPEQVTLLIIDDEKKEFDLLANRLMEVPELLNRIECVYAANLAEGREILKNDAGNAIKVLICDYRFYDQNGRFSLEQGYHILNEIAKMQKTISFIALTGVDPDYINRFQKNVLSRIVTFQKDRVLADDRVFFHFLGTILEANRQMESLLNILWDFKNPLYHRCYVRHKHQDKDGKWEQMIGDTAEQFVLKVKHNIPLRAHDYDNYEFFAKILKSNPEGKNLENFRAKLIGRRIALGLYQLMILNKKSHQEKSKGWIRINNLLRTGEEGRGERGEISDLLNTHLRLYRSKYDYAWNAQSRQGKTIEEIQWLAEKGPIFID